MGKCCAICGKPTGTYMFCREHQKEKEEGAIVKCEECGTWHYYNEPCPNCSKIAHYRNSITNDNELTCIICGQISNGKHFCRSCYAKYKDKAIDVRIKNCTEFSVLDAYGNLQYKCDDGRKVRSRAEKLISDFLFNNKIRAVYEENIFYKENGEDKILKPDFYLPDYNIYIEYNELKNPKYLKSKEYTQKKYEELEKKVIIMTDNDLLDIPAFLKPKLNLH